MRIVKEYDQRHKEILQSAQKLFFSNGYSKTSIQDIIRANEIAKGTFYHYFDSKNALLEALVKHLIEQNLALIETAVDDGSLNAIDKLKKIYSVTVQFKQERKAAVWTYLQALYRDENILLLHKLKHQSVAASVPLISKVIAQGVDEGVFEVDYPQEAAELFLQTSQAFSEAFALVLLNRVAYDDPAAAVKRKKHVHERTMEQILNAPAGSLPLFDTAVIDAWFQE